MKLRAPALRGGVCLLPLALLIASCAASNAESNAASTPAVVLALKDDHGRPIGVEDFRGRPLLLLVFATYDNASQLALLALDRFASQHHGIAALGIAAQPQANQLLPLHRDTLGISMPLAYDPQEQLIEGHSDLGPIQVIPSYVLLDAGGHVRASHAGALDEHGLQAFLDAAGQ
jgi:hypothetical protein